MHTQAVTVLWYGQDGSRTSRFHTHQADAAPGNRRTAALGIVPPTTGAHTHRTPALGRPASPLCRAECRHAHPVQTAKSCLATGLESSHRTSPASTATALTQLQHAGVHSLQVAQGVVAPEGDCCRTPTLAAALLAGVVCMRCRCT